MVTNAISFCYNDTKLQKKGFTVQKQDAEANFFDALNNNLKLKSDKTEAETNDKKSMNEIKKLSFLEGAKAFFGGVREKANNQIGGIINLAKIKSDTEDGKRMLSIASVVLSAIYAPIDAAVSIYSELYGSYMSYISNAKDSDIADCYNDSKEKIEIINALHNVGYKAIDIIQDVKFSMNDIFDNDDSTKDISRQFGLDDALADDNINKDKQTEFLNIV